jgi:hypothetical protein
MSHEIINIGLNLIKNYSPKITDRIDYFSRFGPEQILVEEDIDIY